ncbi:MAG: fimbrillin family protein [Bacteroidales bacterium]|nr:fimbrillin family protein [Bacteroidales bacterium]
MKKILFVAATVALMAAGCTKTEVINPVGNKMGFATGMGKLTKAAGTADADNDGDVNLQAQDFRVWAYADYEDNNTTAIELDQIYDGMANMNVYYTAPAENAPAGTLGTWSPIKEYYWPGVDKNLRFFAVSGLDLGDDLSRTEKVAIAINRTAGTDAEGNSTTVVAPTLTVKDFIVNHEEPNADLMVADFLRQNQSDKIVDLAFRHALTKVEFLFKTLEEADDVVFVQSLSVAGVKTKSTLTVSENKDQSTMTTRPMNFVWATPDETQVFTDDYDKTDGTFPTSVEAVNASGTLTGENLDTTVMKLTTDATNFCTWLAMPQDITGLKVVVTYVVGERQFISEFDLKVGDFSSWNVNQYVRYTVTLCPGKISFDANVDTWKQYDADGDEENNDQDIEYQN